MKRIAHWKIVAAVSPALLVGPRAAKADPSAADRSIAQSLFDEARDLMDAGKFSEACPKLEESERLDPGGGTMLNLALCHESEGRIATAWSDFKEALGFARRQGRSDREQAAVEHIAALEKKLPRVTLTVTTPVAGEQVTLDGNAISQAVWGRATPFDPGKHQLVVTAQGKKTWQTEFDLVQGEQKAVTVPALEDESAAAPAAAAAPVAEPAATTADTGEDPSRKKRMIGYVVGGTGIVALGVGSFFGVRALSKKSQSDDECPSDDTCTKKGVSLNDEAKTSAWIANFGVGLGLVGIGVGAYFLLTAGSGKEGQTAQSGPAPRKLWLDANALPNGGRVTVGGAW